MRACRPVLLLCLALFAGATAGCPGPILKLPAPEEPRTTPLLRPGAGGGPARAFVIEREADLLGGVEADGQLGDLRLDNGRVVFIVDRAAAALGFAESGGNLIDAAPVGSDDALKQIIGYLDDTFPRQPVYHRVEPGRRGPVALVRAVGVDSQDRRITIETEYALSPGSQALQITSRLTNTGPETITDYEVGDAIQWGRVERFAPGHGWRVHGPITLAGGWLGGLGAGAAYAYASALGPLPGGHGSAWSDLNVATVILPPGGTATVTRWLVVSPRTSPLYAEVAAIRGETVSRLSGHILEDATGRALGGMRVLVEDGSGRLVGVVESDATGAYQAALTPGAYQVRAEGRGRRGPDGVDVTLAKGGAARLDLVMSRPAALSFQVSEDGSPSPGKLTVLGLDDARDPLLGPPFEAPGGNVAFTADGRGRIELAPGRYRLVASRGPEFTVAVKDVEVKAGETREVAFALERAIDTRGYLCVDPHQHALPSPDSGVLLGHRAVANLAEGLEALVATDHNVIADYAPAIAALAATRPLPFVPGDEATLDGLGHWNAFPIAPRHEHPHGGAFDVRGRDAHQILAGLRAGARPQDRVVVVTHPRAGIIGYFNTVGFDPAAPALPKDWEGGFDAIEVFSAKDVTRVEQPLRDWFSLLDRGLPYVALGGSDSHLVYGQEVGYPRSCVAVSDDDPARLTAAALVEGIRQRRDVVVTNGPFVRVNVGGRGMGQLAPAPRGRARLEIEVQAAPWVDVRAIEVFVGGNRRGKPIAVPASRAALRYRGHLDLKIDRDSYVVLVVRGEASLEPVVSRLEGQPAPTPLAITNPIFLDRDGDGKFSPPRR